MTDVNSWIFLLLGLGGGFLLSFCLWWLTNHYLVPELAFSVEVSRSKVDFIKSGIRHQIAIKNSGARDAYNIKIRFRIKIKDILQNGGKLWDFRDVTLATNEYFILKKGGMWRLTPLPHMSESFGRNAFPESIRHKYEYGILTLDDVFEEYPDARLFVEAIATDRFSGGAKYFRSKEYERYDIRNGVFRGSDPDSIHKQKRLPSRRSADR